MDAWIGELKYSIRMLFKSPGLASILIVTLALGTGATTAIFSIVNAVLLKPLPVSDPDRLVMLLTTEVSETGEIIRADSEASPLKFELWRAQTNAIQLVSAFSKGILNYSGNGAVEQWRSIRASADFFRCWGMPTLQGRTFLQEEDFPGGPRVGVISRNLWERRFARDPEILGKTLLLNGEPYVIIGILGESAGLQRLGFASDIYMPLQIDPNTDDEGNYLTVVARLTPGVTLAQAKERLQAFAQNNRAKYPNTIGKQGGFTLRALREALVGEVRPLLAVLLSAVGLVLLIGCANAASLLLVRTASRRREIAVRAAVGGSRCRIVRQLLTESVVLSLAGGALGLALGYAGMRALLAVNTAGLPLVGPEGSAVNVDWRVMSFALALSLSTGLLFGAIPALQGSRTDLNSLLNDRSGRLAISWRWNPSRAALVASEAALAVILLVGSALLLRSFLALYRLDRGFQTKNVVTMQTWLGGARYLRAEAAAEAIGAGLDRVQSLPGVAAAAVTCCLPLEGGYGLPFEIVGRESPATLDIGGSWSVVSPGYFDVFKIPLKRGRVFTGRDDAKAAPVVMISERMAKEYWTGRDPLQDQIVIGRGFTMKEFKNERPRQIIGIVGDVRNAGVNPDPTLDLVMYVPQAQVSDAENAFLARNRPMAWAIRTRRQTPALLAVIREQVRQSTGLPVSDVLSMDRVFSSTTKQPRFNVLLMNLFGTVALLLAAIGIYGLVAYTVEQRRYEIGVRLALGADTGQVRNMVLRQGMSVVLTGVLLGIGAASALSRVLESLLFGVRAQDPIVFLLVPVVLCAVALLAAWLPANKASRSNPIDSLRCQ
jgi:predicted permease